MTFRLAGLWHYPVKTLAGKALDTAELTAGGIPGDRIVHVRGPEGVRTSRRQPCGLQLGMTAGWKRTTGLTASTSSRYWSQPMGPSLPLGATSAACAPTF